MESNITAVDKALYWLPYFLHDDRKDEVRVYQDLLKQAQKKRIIRIPKITSVTEEVGTGRNEKSVGNEH